MITIRFCKPRLFTLLIRISDILKNSNPLGHYEATANRLTNLYDKTKFNTFNFP